MEEIHAYLVDWDEFVRRWQRQQPMTDFDWFFDAANAGESWVLDYSRAVQGWSFRLMNWMDAGTAYDDMRPELSPELTARCDEVFPALFPTHDNPNVRDLPGEDALPENLRFAVTMSPASVRRCREAAPALPFDELQAAFEQSAWTDFEDFAEFRDYLQQWINLLQQGSQSHRGIAVP